MVVEGLEEQSLFFFFFKSFLACSLCLADTERPLRPLMRILHSVPIPMNFKLSLTIILLILEESHRT